MQLIEDARHRGAKIVEAGLLPESANERIRTIAPTLVINPDDSSAIM